MKENRSYADLTDEEKNRPYAKYFYKEPARIPADVRSALEAGPMDPAAALPFGRINDLLNPGYLEKEIGYCLMPDNSGYTAMLTRMPGVTGEMLDWWFCWHALEGLRYKIWYPGKHVDNSVRDRGRLEDPALPCRERYRDNPQYPVEDVGVGPDILSITFVNPSAFGFDTSRFQEARVATVICGLVGSVTKKARHTFMCHFVRQDCDGVEMRSRFWVGRNIKLDLFDEKSPVNRLANTRFIRKMLIPRDTPLQLALHCTQEYNNLAEILPELYREYGGRLS
jgi:phloretin hydrolase